MVNPEEVLQSLDEFSKLKPKDIPRELEEYLMYVAKTGDPVYQWSVVKCLFREKMLNVITDFYESCPSIDVPPCPNVDPFNYETMKASLLERLESFSNAPFTVQRLSELLTTPRKEYTRVDKFMRAIEKNILVVSTKEPGGSRSRSDSQPAQSQPPDVLMNGVMDARGGAGGLDIGEAIETVSAEGVNLMHGNEAVGETTDVSLADTIRVECEDIEMDDGTTATAVVWDTKASGCVVTTDNPLKTLSITTTTTPDSTAASGSGVWESSKADECGVNGDSAPDTSVWDTKETDCSDEGLKSLSPTPESIAGAGDSSSTTPKPSEEDHEATAVAVVSEFLDPSREVFGQSVELSSVPLVLTESPDSNQTNVGISAECNVEVTSHNLGTIVSEADSKEEEPHSQEPVSETDSKDLMEQKDSESEDTSQVDPESGISCSADGSSASSDCATAEMNQTLETNGSLEITSVESEVMSPLEGLEDAANASPQSPTLEDREANTPPPTFAEMTADEDTQDAVRNTEPLDDEDDDDDDYGEDTDREALKSEPGTKTDSDLSESVAVVETKMDIDEEEQPSVEDDVQTTLPVVEQCVLEVPTEGVELQSEVCTEDEATSDQTDPSASSYIV